MSRRRQREWLGRVGLILLGFVLAGVLVEAALQAGGLLLGSATRGRLPASWVTDRLRVLCLGDSNTFGLNLEREEAYPHQLEVLWNEKIASPKIEVLNLGYPGTNSTMLIRDFDRVWRTLAPDVVIVMIGVNDFWTEPLPREADDALSFLRRHSRLYRLYLLMGRATGNEVEYGLDPDGKARVRIAGEDFAVGTRGSGRARKRESVESDLLTLIDRIRSRGVALHLTTYPARTRLYAYANPTIRSAATRTGTPLVDLAAVFDRVCPDHRCPELLFEDNHPTHAGYQLVAQAVLAQLAPDLVTRAERPR